MAPILLLFSLGQGFSPPEFPRRGNSGLAIANSVLDWFSREREGKALVYRSTLQG
ncbi:MAG: hypothetical protein M3O33_17975 [Cyanobacteriota bacterium]|nr:hypothetical protein [Cyanobacteriota bacterium]